jgi:hypothetical protein
MVLENFTDLENILDCECCVLDSFDDALGSTTGIYVTLSKLKEICAKLKAHRLETTIHTLRVMQNHTQSRIFVHSKGGMLSSHLGIAINWLEDKITGLIIIKNANEATFFEDDTTPAPSLHQHQHQHEPPPARRRHTLAGDGGADPPPSSLRLSELTLAPEEAAAALSLSPPFLCPRPPPLPATLAITVLSCCNLKSCMRRVITRAVDAYVIVSVNGQERRTEVVTGTNPW